MHHEQEVCLRRHGNRLTLIAGKMLEDFRTGQVHHLTHFSFQPASDLVPLRSTSCKDKRRSHSMVTTTTLHQRTRQRGQPPYLTFNKLQNEICCCTSWHFSKCYFVLHLHPPHKDSDMCAPPGGSRINWMIRELLVALPLMCWIGFSASPRYCPNSFHAE